MAIVETELDFYTAELKLKQDSPIYIERLSDEELYNAVLTRRVCYVLARQGMGKSSLMRRTGSRLQEQGYNTATLSMGEIDTSISQDELHLWLLKRLKSELNLSVDPDSWLAEPTAAGDPFVDLLREVILFEVEGQIIIFIDDIDGVPKNSGFLDEIFNAIQFFYYARANEAVYDRLTFVLLGALMPVDLIENGNQAFIGMGQPMPLLDFTREEIQQFQQAFQGTQPENREIALDRIFYWTRGHPYLTQELCAAAAQDANPNWTEERIDYLVERTFLSGPIDSDPNLRYVSDSIKHTSRRRPLLKLYRQIYRGKSVPVDSQSLDHSRLQFIGLVSAENGELKVRNEIYRSVFNRKWIKKNTPVNWMRFIDILAISFAIVLAVSIGFYLFQQSQEPDEAQVFIEKFKNASKPSDRLESLAGLFSLPGYEDHARDLFFGELSQADQLAIFDLANPQSRGQQIVTVAQGIYADSNLRNNWRNNRLLTEMTEALLPLGSSQLSAVELREEITYWLEGRDYYLNQEEYQPALEAYDAAIELNGNNPGIYFDRGLTYVSRGQSDLALADLATVLRLDESYKARVEEVLANDGQLYSDLWASQGEYWRLIALVPTPTNTATSTPTPTSTATSTPLPTSTPTKTPIPPTSTATPLPTATAIPLILREPTSTPTSTLTPTPSIPTGTFELLYPLSFDDDVSYGPTNFEWEWRGPVPPDYGFEIRVWREGEFPTGAHNAILDNQKGNVISLGQNKYQLRIDISDAAGVKSGSGIYLWTVALVRVDPKYADLGLQAEPTEMQYAASGQGDGSGGDGNGDSGGGGSSGGGGVGID